MDFNYSYLIQPRVVPNQAWSASGPLYSRGRFYNFETRDVQGANPFKLVQVGRPEDQTFAVVFDALGDTWYLQYGGNYNSLVFSRSRNGNFQGGIWKLEHLDNGFSLVVDLGTGYCWESVGSGRPIRWGVTLMPRRDPAPDSLQHQFIPSTYIGPTPQFRTTTRFVVHLDSVTSHASGEGTPYGTDDLYIKHEGRSIQDFGANFPVGRTALFEPIDILWQGAPILIEFWDHNQILSDTRLGTARIDLGQNPQVADQSVTIDMTPEPGTGARYSLSYTSSPIELQILGDNDYVWCMLRNSLSERECRINVGPGASYLAFRFDLAGSSINASFKVVRPDNVIISTEQREEKLLATRAQDRSGLDAFVVIDPMPGAWTAIVDAADDSVWTLFGTTSRFEDDPNRNQANADAALEMLTPDQRALMRSQMQRNDDVCIFCMAQVVVLGAFLFAAYTLFGPGVTPSSLQVDMAVRLGVARSAAEAAMRIRSLYELPNAPSTLRSVVETTAAICRWEGMCPEK